LFFGSVFARAPARPLARRILIGGLVYSFLLRRVMCGCEPESVKAIQVRDFAWKLRARLWDVPMDDETFAFVLLRLLPLRSWWRMRELSSGWRSLLDGPFASYVHDSHALKAGVRDRGCLGLIPILVEATGPLTTPNAEIDFAGCVYTAVHHGSAGPLRLLLRPLTVFGWARQSFALAVAREALVQAAVAGDAASCSAVLSARGPNLSLAAPGLDSGAGGPLYLGKADAALALEAAAEWESMSPGSAPPHCRAEVDVVLRQVC